MRLIRCEEGLHTEPILAIFNEAILNSTALYEYQARTAETMRAWFATKRAAGFPVIGAVDDAGTLMGFASFGTFRAFPAFKYTVEHSIYVEQGFRGRGLGQVLLQAIEQEAIAAKVHVMVGAIDAQNQKSIDLHKRCGFQPGGVIHQAGFKFGRWLDLVFYQKILASALQPQDG